MELSSFQKQIRANVLLIIAAAVWGFAFVAQVEASKSGIGSFLYNGIRYLIGAAVLIPIVFLFERKKINKSVFVRTLIAGAICGLVMLAAVNFQQYGIDNNLNSGKSGFLTDLYIVFIPITGLFMGKKIGSNAWLAVFMAIVGVFLISFPIGAEAFNKKELFGDFLVFVGAIFWTVQILCLDRFAKESCPILLSVLQFVVCGLVSLLISLFVDDISFSIIESSMVPILYGGLVSVGIGYTLQVLGQRDASAVVASIAMAGESIFACLGGILILDESMSIRQLIGASLMILAILVAQIKFPSRNTEKKS